MKKRVLLISGNYYPEPTGIGKFNNEMMTWLADHHFDCTVISTYPYYPNWSLQPAYKRRNKWFCKEEQLTANNNKIVIYRCPHYVPAKPSGAKRMLLEITYLSTLALKLIRLTGKKFDYVFTVVPPVSLGLLAVNYKKFTKAKLLYHIQDLQIDVANDLKMIRSKQLINQLFRLEKYILHRADKISTISPGMAEKVRKKTNQDVFVFPNWANINFFKPLQNREDLKLSFGFQPSVPVILYSGSIGEKQGLEIMLEAAKLFQQNNVSAQFVICGSGPYKTILEVLAIEKQLSNIRFLNLQPIEQLNSFFNAADVHLVVQKANVADHVMPSKLTSILAVGGLPVVTANTGSDLHRIITQNKIGLVCEAENVQSLYDTLKDALHDNYSAYRNNARHYAENNLSQDLIMHNYITNVMLADD